MSFAISVEDAAKLSFKNRSALERQEEASCYYCMRVFPVDEIEEWVDGEQTPLCPHCEIDAVVPGRQPLTWLQAASMQWFTPVLPRSTP